MGADLSGVRLHTSDESARIAKSIGARAFTKGRDVHFGAGEFKPDTSDGRHVLAHELAHATSPTAGAAVHRFPATALAGPIGWKEHNPSVMRPGEGASGGVYILQGDPKDEVSKVVVKPVFGRRGDYVEETAEQLVFSDRVMTELFGISAPVSRSVQKGSKEFEELMELCLPKAPSGPKKTGNEANDEALKESFLHLSQAQSFVVMSEVPQAKSVGSLVDKAGTDRASSRALYDLLFSQGFLSQLGRVTVADILLGNNDRLVGGEMGNRKINLGNILVSTAKGEPTVYAIDTTAVLGEFDPKSVVASGTASKTLNLGFGSAKQELTGAKGYGPAGIVDAFFKMIIQHLQAGTKQLGGHRGKTAGPAELIESTYQRNRDSLIASFEMGWQDALTRVFELVSTQEGRHQMRGVVGSFEGSPGGANVKKSAFKTNAMYLAGIAQGKGHEESATDPHQYARRRVLQEFDVAKLLAPPDGFHSLLARVPKGALSADLPEGLKSLPHPEAIGKVRVNGKGRNAYSTYMESNFNDVATAVSKAKEEAATFGTKPGKDGQQATNRARAGLFLAECYGLGIGAARAVALSGQALEYFERVKDVTGFKLTANQTSEILARFSTARSVTGPNKTQLKNYARSLGDAAAGVQEMKKYRNHKVLANHLRNMEGWVITAADRYDSELQLLNLNLLENLLKGMVAKKG